jgi:hypothetical protein
MFVAVFLSWVAIAVLAWRVILLHQHHKEADTIIDNILNRIKDQKL